MTQSQSDLFESQVEETMKKLGFQVQKQKYIRTNWRADIVGRAADGSIIAIEVKTSRIGIPDVLAVASAASSGSRIGESMSGAIVSTVPTPPAIAKIARANDVTILTVDRSSDLLSKLGFLGLIARIESRLRKISARPPETKMSDVIDKVEEIGALDAEMIREVRELWDLRNSLVHSIEEKDSFDEKWIEFADSTLKRLENPVRTHD